MGASPEGSALRGQLAGWAALGLIDAGQAARIEVAEAERAAVAAGVPGRSLL
jgi:hypothetical protein